MMDCSVTSVIFADVTFLRHDNCRPFTSLVGGLFVDQWIGSKISLEMHESLLEAHWVVVHVVHNNLEDDQTKQEPLKVILCQLIAFCVIQVSVTKLIYKV